MFGCAVATQQTQQVKSTKTQELPKPALKTETKAVVEKDRIAVIGLKNKAGVKQNELNYLSDILRDVASKLPNQKYSVMTEDNIQVMLPPETKLEDCEGVCAVTTGRNVGAHWVLVGSVVRFGKSLRVTIRLHHTASGEVRGSEQLKGNTVEDLEFPLKQAGFRLFSVLDPTLLELVKTEPKIPQVVKNEKLPNSTKNVVISASSTVSEQEPQVHVKPVASNLLVTYVARISEQDKQTSNGKLISNAKYIITQDRANVHRFDIKDPEDQIDTEFGERTRRRWLTQRLMATTISSSVAKQIQSGNPLIRVSVFNNGKVKVELEKSASQSNESTCKLARVIGLDQSGDNFLSVRQGPSSRYLEVNRLYANAVVCVSEKRKKWYAISYQSKSGRTAPCSTEKCNTGWVFGKYIMNVVQ